MTSNKQYIKELVDWLDQDDRMDFEIARYFEIILDQKDNDWKELIMKNLYNKQNCEKINELFLKS